MTAIPERDEDCRACCGTGCSLGPDGCNGRAHLFIGCSTCIACRGSGLAHQSGSPNPLTHVGREGPEQQVRFEDDGLDSGSEVSL